MTDKIYECEFEKIHFTLHTFSCTLRKKKKVYENVPSLSVSHDKCKEKPHRCDDQYLHFIKQETFLLNVFIPAGFLV